MKVIAVRGKRNSGKTFLIELLTKKFKEKGLRVGVIKHAHHRPEFDLPGKDSFRMVSAGADKVVLVWNGGTISISNTDLEFKDILSSLNNLDIIFVEGFNTLPLPAIEILDEGEKPSPESIGVIRKGEIERELERMISIIESYEEKIKPSSGFRMIDVSEKLETIRKARARAVLSFSPDVWSTVKEGKVEKGDLFQMAKIGAISGAKHTSVLLPLCHPVGIDHILVEVVPSFCTLEIQVEVKGTGRTGMEMEALTAAVTAALSIYDLLKRHGEGIKISNLELMEKSGGKSDYEKDRIPFSAAVITVSDRAYRGERADESGEIIKRWVIEKGGEVRGYEIVPDEKEEIKKRVLYYTSVENPVDLIITTGGTGAGPRDVTVIALEEICWKRLDGIGELMRDFGRRKTLYAVLSGGCGYVIGKTIAVALPGSPSGVRDSLKVLEGIVYHVIRMARGEGH